MLMTQAYLASLLSRKQLGQHLLNTGWWILEILIHVFLGELDAGVLFKEARVPRIKYICNVSLKHCS